MSTSSNIKPVEINPRVKIEEIVEPKKKSGPIENNIPSVSTTRPKEVLPTQPVPPKDNSWLGEEEAEKQLDKDPHANPNVEIATPDFFQPITNEEVSIVDKKDILEKLEDAVQEIKDQPELKEKVKSELSQIIQETVPESHTLDASITFSDSEKTPTISQQDDMKSNVTEDLPSQEDDWTSNVKEDAPEIPETYQPGMDNMTDTTHSGPIIMDTDELVEDFDLEATESVDHEEPVKEDSVPVETIQESYETSTSPIMEDAVESIDTPDESMNPEMEAPLIEDFGFFREAMKETIIPLHQEELAQQIIAAFPNEDSDPAHIQKMKVQAIRNPNTFSGHINRAMSFLSNEQARQSEVFKKLHGPMGQTKVIGGKRFGDSFTDRNHSKLTKSSTVVGGDKAIQTAMSLISGIRRIALYNSGFNVVIRPPLLNELHQYFMRCRSSVQEFGRQFGQYSFLPADVELKAATMDLFESLVIDSNLKDWKISKTLRKYISILDYEVLLWGMATLMFPEGTQTEMFCNKRDCKHVDIAKIDVTKMRFNDYSKLTDEAIQFVCATGQDSIRSPEDLDKYHREILSDIKDLTVNDEWTVSVATPSIDKVISDGEVYVAHMASKIQLKNGIDVADFLNTKYFRIFAPWINRISYCDKKTGNYIHFTTPIQLPEIIEALQLDSINIPLDKTIVEFMNEKKISHFGYLYSQCPKCMASSDLAINGIIPCDMQYAFFTLTMDRIS